MIVSPFIADGAYQSARRASATTQGSVFQDLLANDLGGGIESNSNLFDFTELGMLGSGQQSNADPIQGPLPAAPSELKAETFLTPSFPGVVKDLHGAPAPPAPPSDSTRFETPTLSPGLVLLNTKADAHLQPLLQSPTDRGAPKPLSLDGSPGSLSTSLSDASPSIDADLMTEREQALQPANGARIDFGAKSEASTTSREPAGVSSTALTEQPYASPDPAENTFNVFLFGDGATASISVVAGGSATPILASLKEAAKNVLKDAGWSLKSFKLNGKYSEFYDRQGAS